MRLISLLIALGILAYLISRQLSSDAPSNYVEAMTEEQTITAPKVPTTPAGVKRFETEINQFIQKTAAERSQELDRLEGSLNK